MNVTECTFESGGERCAGTLMRPDASSFPPVIVMAHGFANLRLARLPAFAERFVDAGYAAFLFDYRTFGDSEGEPRHWVHPNRQIEDWHAAVNHVKTRADIDASRLILWGTSFSGGHVLRVSANRDDISAVIAQIPHVSGISAIAKAPFLTALKTTLAGMYGMVTAPFGVRHYTPVAGEPGELTVITGDNAPSGYYDMLPAGTDWENRVLSRSLPHLVFYTPRRDASRIVAPSLIVACRYDSVTPARAAKRAADRLPNGRFELLDCDHFQAYFGAHFEQNVNLQLEFLQEHVPAE